jgi:hypothetical protein
MGEENPVAGAPITDRQRCSGDGLEVSPPVLGEQPSGRLAGPAWVQIGPQSGNRGISIAAIGVITPEVQQLCDLVEAPTKRELGNPRSAGVVIAVLGSDTSQDAGPDHAVLIVAAIGDDQAPEPFPDVRRAGGQSVVKPLDHRSGLIDGGLVHMAEHDVRVFVERRNATRKQVAAVHVVVSGPLEVLSAGLAKDEVMVWDGADVARLTNVPDSRVLGRIPAADLFSPVRRGIVRDDQLEVGETLTKQRVDRLREITFPVVYGKADTEPW